MQGLGPKSLLLDRVVPGQSEVRYSARSGPHEVGETPEASLGQSKDVPCDEEEAEAEEEPYWEVWEQQYDVLVGYGGASAVLEV